MNIRRYLAQVGPNLCASDNGSEFINHHLLAWCEKRKITFTRSRPGNSNDGCHVEQKNWAIVRTVVGYHRYDSEAELLLRGKIWVLQSQLANYFCPQQKLVSKGPQRREGRQEVRHGDHPTPSRRTPQSGRETRQGDPCRHLHRHQPCRRPTADPGADHGAADAHHQQGWAGQTPPLHARTLE